jgi:hypothetical protein
MFNFRLAFVLVACVSLAACVIDPPSRTSQESSQPTTLAGFVGSPGQDITIQAVDQNSGSLVTLGTATSSPSATPYTAPSGTSYKLYHWSFNAGVLAANLWSPQEIVADLKTAQGHLEIFASAGGQNLYTFSQAARDSWLASGKDLVASTPEYSDGTSTVLFDQDGVGNGPETPWVTVAGMISSSHSPYYSPVAWSVGYYTVEGGKKIYGLICSPTEGGPYPVVVYNHGGTDRGDVDLGGTDLGNGGGLTGVVTAAGWTSQPFVATPLAPGGVQIFPDSLGQCLDWAKRGWIFATSSYRGEQVHITSASPEFPASSTWTSDGVPELCMGEVTDAMALADLLANHASSIELGSTAEKVKIAPNGKLLMYGYSHGGCITYRAVEQGAPVTAFSVIEGFTDFRLAYMNIWNNGVAAAGLTLEQTAAAGSGAGKPSAANFSGGFYYPDANGVMGYNWRSAHYFASRGDLSIQKFKTMPILIFHGDVDKTSANGQEALNPVFLDEAAEIAADIGATNIFVGPGGAVTPPTSEPCVAGAVGAPFPDANNPPATVSCPIAFNQMDTGDPCLSPSPTGFFSKICLVLKLPLPPAPGQPQQQHYFVVYHNMNHINGGPAIKETFNRFAELGFDRQPGCDGLEIDCNSD